MERIYLVGFMGSGKSSFGKKLANAIGWKFTDLDDLIEKGQGKSITEIFETDGENLFRGMEKKYLESTFEMKQVVIATGGGTPCFGNNMDKMLENGTVVFLDLPVKVLLARIYSHKSKRPLIKDIADEKLEEFIAGKLEDRHQYYVRAHYRCNLLKDSLQEVINILFKN